MEQIKYFNFYRESNNFDDILEDKVLSKHIFVNLIWSRGLRIGIATENVESLTSYIVLKYGDEYRSNVSKDYSPKPNIDYLVKRKIT